MLVTQQTGFRRSAVWRVRSGLQWMRGRWGHRRVLRHLLEVDDYLLDDMGVPRDWLIAEGRRQGIWPGLRGVGGRHRGRGGAGLVRGLRDGFW